MGNFSHLQLQKALYEALSGDAALLGMVVGIFDRVPEETAFPYVILGEAKGRDWSTKTSTGIRFAVELHVFSRTGGRKEVAGIMERIHTLVHEAPLTLTGHTLVMIRFDTSEIILEDDGLTYKGTLRFQALVEAH